MIKKLSLVTIAAMALLFIPAQAESMKCQAGKCGAAMMQKCKVKTDCQSEHCQKGKKEKDCTKMKCDDKKKCHAKKEIKSEAVKCAAN